MESKLVCSGGVPPASSAVELPASGISLIPQQQGLQLANAPGIILLAQGHSVYTM